MLTVVIDVGTSSTNMGYASNEEPTFVEPTMVAEPMTSKDALADMVYLIGREAADGVAPGWRVSSPVRHGLVEDWNCMEKYWQQSFYQYLRVEPDQAGVLLTEPPGNPPESREYTAEVMFETFGVRRLHIAMQSALTLRACGSFTRGDGAPKGSADAEVAAVDTGLVVDCGAGAATVVPIVDGYVVSHAVRRVPLAGDAITDFFLGRLRERKTALEPSESLTAARRLKERYGYVCRDLPREVELFDRSLPGRVIRHRELSRRTGQYCSVEVGDEQFLGPELYFHPELFGSQWTTPLPEMISAAIDASPIDYRRALYKNVVLSGGSALFPHFAQRLQDELHSARARRAGKRMSDGADVASDVKVVLHERPLYAAWRGGSILASSTEFEAVATTKQEYDEEGPGVLRRGGALPAGV